MLVGFLRILTIIVVVPITGALVAIAALYFIDALYLAVTVAVVFSWFAAQGVADLLVRLLKKGEK